MPSLCPDITSAAYIMAISACEKPSRDVYHDIMAACVCEKPSRDVHPDGTHLGEITGEIAYRRPVARTQHEIQRRGASPPREIQRVLQLAALDDGADLDLHRFLEGAFLLLPQLEALGTWTFIAAREVRANLCSLRQSAAFRECARLRAVLAAETAGGVHKEGILADGTAALALTWLTRLLGLWVAVWREPRPPTFKQALDAAYDAHMRPYHGWIARKAFALATSCVPTWAAARELYADYDAEGEAGVIADIAALAPLLERIRAALAEMGLHDERTV